MPESRAVVEQSTPYNRLLGALPREELALLAADLENMPLAFKQSIYESGRPIDCVYFLHRGVVSLVHEMGDGTTIEIATVGPEGFVGLPVFLGASLSAEKAFAQVPGQASRMEARAFRRVLDRTPQLHGLLSRYTLALLNQLAQNAACHRVHELEQRLARWLLVTQDRVHGPTFSLTQELMAQMLGVARPTVSIAASILQRQGLISYVRGNITVTDREGLEAASCECYRVVRNQLDRLVAGGD